MWLVSAQGVNYRSQAWASVYPRCPKLQGSVALKPQCVCVGGVLQNQSHPQRPITLLPEFLEEGSQEVTSTQIMAHALRCISHPDPQQAAQVTEAASES